MNETTRNKSCWNEWLYWFWSLIWTVWSLGDVIVILKVQSPNTCYRLSSWALPVKLLSDENHRTPLMLISHHWFSWWLDAVWQQAINWANVDSDSQYPYGINKACCHLVEGNFIKTVLNIIRYKVFKNCIVENYIFENNATSPRGQWIKCMKWKTIYMCCVLKCLVLVSSDGTMEQAVNFIDTEETPLKGVSFNICIVVDKFWSACFWQKMFAFCLHIWTSLKDKCRTQGIEKTHATFKHELCGQNVFFPVQLKGQISRLGKASWVDPALLVWAIEIGWCSRALDQGFKV